MQRYMLHCAAAMAMAAINIWGAPSAAPERTALVCIAKRPVADRGSAC